MTQEVRRDTGSEVQCGKRGAMQEVRHDAGSEARCVADSSVRTSSPKDFAPAFVTT